MLALAERAGVRVGEVYEVDASRRTTAVNAYVTGLGPTKRVVLFDTLLRDFPAAEVNLVVAHELGHVRFRDVARGMGLLAVVAPVGAAGDRAAGGADRARRARAAAGRAARSRAGRRAARARRLGDRLPALARDRGARRRLRARADRRPGDADRLRAPGDRSRT